MRLLALLILGLILGVQVAGAIQLVGSTDADCQHCAPCGGCGDACVACPACSGSVPAGEGHGLSGVVLGAILGALSHEVELALSPAYTEILHIPKPTLF